MCTLQSVSDELDAQRLLNKKQLETIDDLLRKAKGIDPKIPTNASTHQVVITSTL